MNWLKEYKDYWIGIGVINVIYAFIQFYTGSQANEGVIGYFFVLLFALFFNAAVSALIFVIGRLFMKELTLFRFVRIFTIWSFINLLINIINVFL